MSSISAAQNIAAEIVDGMLTIKVVVDPDKVETRPTKSGKSDLFATSGGALQLAGGLSLNLNVYRKR